MNDKPPQRPQNRPAPRKSIFCLLSSVFCLLYSVFCLLRPSTSVENPLQINLFMQNKPNLVRRRRIANERKSI